MSQYLISWFDTQVAKFIIYRALNIPKPVNMLGFTVIIALY